MTPKRTSAALSMLARTGRRIAVSESFIAKSLRPEGWRSYLSVVRRGLISTEATIHVRFQNLEEFGHDTVALERHLEPAVDVDGRLRFLEGPGQRNADVSVL